MAAKSPGTLFSYESSKTKQSHLKFCFPSKRSYTISDLILMPSQEDFRHLEDHTIVAKPEEVSNNPKSKYDLNWLNFYDLFIYREFLDKYSRELLFKFAKSKWSQAEYLENGLKATNGTLAQSILLLIAAEISNILPNASMIVESNLRDKDGKYSPRGTKRRFISPKAARLQISKFNKVYAPRKLFPAHHAYLVLFESSNELRDVGRNYSQRRQDYERFFDENRNQLKLWKRKKKIRAFFLSHEITCLSIRDFKFNPHSHAIVWLDNASDASFIDEFIENGLSIKYEKRPITKWDNLEHFVDYLMRAHSLAAVYKKEFTMKDAREFNKSTIEAFHALVELQCGDGGKPGNRKIFKEGIPTTRGS